MDFTKLSREDWMVGGGGIVLIISLLFFDWYSDNGFGAAAVSSPYSIWGVLALIVTIVIVVDLALARFSPSTQMPTTQLGRDMTRVAACGLLLLFLFIKFLSHVGSFGFGFFLDIIFAAVVSAGAWFLAQGRSTPTGIGGGSSG